MTGCTYMKSPKWTGVREAVLKLADNMRKYVSFLDGQSDATGKRQKQVFLASDVDHWDILPAKVTGKPSMQAQYHTLHQALEAASLYQPIFVNDLCPADRRRRWDYYKHLKENVPVMCALYVYTGSKEHLHFLWKVAALASEGERLAECNKVKTSLESQLPKYHTRAMKREFRIKFGTVCNIGSAVLREMYTVLTGDASAAENLPEAKVDERLREALSLEDSDLVWDLPANNSRNGEKYTIFLEECQSYLNSQAELAVDDRRHNQVVDCDPIVHLAQALNARTLHEEVTKRCPPGTAVPSVQWLRYQFWPRTSRQCFTHTGKLKIKYMIQARQMRQDHVDAHFASAYFRYQKEFACEFREHTSYVGHSTEKV